MRAQRITVTMPEDVARSAREAVAAGESPSVSAFVAEAVQEKTHRHTLRDCLDELKSEIGPPDVEAQAWARRVLDRLP
jgi:Arc/MetJ-type ribon-helix-helix transcriptional regulator